MRRVVASLLACLLASLAVPAAPASAAKIAIPVPAAGDITVAHITMKGRGKARAPRLTNKLALGSPLTIVGGTRKLPHGKKLVSVVVVRRSSGDPGAKSVKVALPKGLHLTRRQVVQSVIAKGGRPTYCDLATKSFAYVKLLFGKRLNGFSAGDTAMYATSISCHSFPRRDEFVASFGGSSGRGEGGDRPGGSGGGGGSDATPNCDLNADGGCPGDEQDPGPKISPTLQGSGSVTQDPDDKYRYTYSISFNEPISGYQMSTPVYIHCPVASYAAWYGECPADSIHPRPEITCEQQAGSSVSDFTCSSGSPDAPGPPVPGGTTIDGVFIDDPSTPPSTSGSVKLTGFAPDGSQSQPAELQVTYAP